MTSSEKLRAIRVKAEEAVADMPDGELKIKAFEVILQQLLTSEMQSKQVDSTISKQQASAKSKTSDRPGSTKSRILLLKDEGFFAVPRAMKEIKTELQAHGWILPMTSLSGPLQTLVQDRLLRRIREQGPKQKIWKYVNP
jgi:hypothetical protein